MAKDDLILHSMQMHVWAYIESSYNDDRIHLAHSHVKRLWSGKFPSGWKGCFIDTREEGKGLKYVCDYIEDEDKMILSVYKELDVEVSENYMHGNDKEESDNVRQNETSSS